MFCYRRAIEFVTQFTVFVTFFIFNYLNLNYCYWFLGQFVLDSVLFSILGIKTFTEQIHPLHSPKQRFIKHKCN